MQSDMIDQHSYFSSAYHHVRRRRIALELIQRKAELKEDECLVCDVGCGEGWYTIVLERRGHLVTGIGISEKRLKRAKTKIHDVDFVRGDVNGMPIKSNVFDLVVCAQLLEHIHNPSVVVKECKRISKSGGALLFKVPSKTNIIDILIKKVLRMDRAPWTTWGLTIDPTHVHFFSQEELLKIFSAQKLKVIEIRGAVALRYTLPILHNMFVNAKGRWWPLLDAIEEIISRIPYLKRYGAIQTFLLSNQG